MDLGMQLILLVVALCLMAFTRRHKVLALVDDWREFQAWRQSRDAQDATAPARPVIEPVILPLSLIHI